MKVIPKFQSGGSSFDSFFTMYTPVETTSKTSEQKSSKTSESSDGELTEKDFFNMLKNINGLPNDMSVIVKDLTNMFQLRNLTGVDTGNLSTLYLQNLYQVKIANQNYEEYQNAIKNANAKGSLAEPAISTDGKLVVQDDSGKIQYLTLEQYYANQDNYYLLSVSNLANLRKYDPNLAYNQSVLDIINNSTGFEEFQSLVDKAKISLGSVKYSETLPLNDKILDGLQQIENLSEDERVNLLSALNNGSIKYSTETNKENIEKLLQYISSVLPERTKIWAAVKLNDPNKENAIKKLIGTYLLGELKTSQTNNISGTKSTKNTKSDGSNDSSLATNPNMGFWSQVLAGMGEDGTYNIINKDILASGYGKYYGTTPGLDEYKSLNKYINDSGIGFVIKNRDNIMFGDNKLVDQNEVVVDPNGGAFVVTLPITPDGKVNFAILEDYNRISDDIISQGYKKDTNEYKIALAQALYENDMGYLIEGTSLNPRMFGRFLILQGIGSSKTQIMSRNKKISLDKSDSKFIIDSSEEGQLFDMLENVLSTDYSKLELDNNWIDFGPFTNDKIYRANIFIPLTNNPNAGMNADNNDVRRAKAYEFENNYQTSERRSKLESLNSTSSENL